MLKACSAVILVFLLIPVRVSFAQTAPGSIKIYSGDFHHPSTKGNTSIWHKLFGAVSTKEDVDPEMQCSVEFQSPVPFLNQTVIDIPEELTYSVSFKDWGGISQGALGKFIIKVYTIDDQEYTIDPEAQGQQIDINNIHHIFDSYLIYLILSQEIDHLEVVSASKDIKGRYVLDKFAIE